MRACIAVFLLLATRVFAQYDCSQPKYSSTLSGSANINVTAGSGWSTDPSGTLAGGMSYWNDTCSQAGGGFPSLCFGCQSDGYPVTVNFVPGSGPACGVHEAYEVDGQPFGSTITLYGSAGGYSCEPITDSLAHELGHVLGLADVSWSGSCYGSIMGGRAPGGTRSVTSDDCAEVDSIWQTSTEPPPKDDTELVDCPTSPILIDLGDGAYVLGSYGSPVSFDINADGHEDLITWTAADSAVGFLAYDRNTNGRIDSGAELFGTATPLSGGGIAANGFEALKEFDSNGDAIIDARDTSWTHLLVWIDANHNAATDVGELRFLATTPVVSISTAYDRIGRRDGVGNLLSYRGFVQFVHGREAVYDVFFRLHP